MIKLEHFGKYRVGLTSDEIIKYIRDRAKGTKFSKYSTKRLRAKFGKLMGVHTGMLVDGKAITYREDVRRFADLMFDGTPTYFD